MVDQEYLSRCVVDLSTKQINIYSNMGSEKHVPCETVDQFMNVLRFIRETIDESQIYYSEIQTK